MPSEPNTIPNTIDRLGDSDTQSDTNLQFVKVGVTKNLTEAERLTIHKYPSDVSSDTTPHYVMFYINVRRGDISHSEKGVQTTKAVFDDSNANRVDRNIGTAAAELAVPVAGGVVGAQTFLSLTGGGSGGLMGRLLTAGAFTAGAVAGRKVMGSDTVSDITSGRSEMVMLTDVIALYMTGKPSAQYQANWADADMGLAAALNKDDMGSVRKNFVESAKKLDLGGMFNPLARIAAGMALKSAEALRHRTLGDIGGVLQTSAGVTPNPFKAQLFKSMGFRTFTFDYKFLPRNITEYEAVKEIIRKFKIYMHPTLPKELYKTVMGYPAEFNIVYYFKRQKNEELFRIANCALTNMKIEYGGDSDLTTFKGYPGAPTEISMQLTFLELEYLTRDRILEGGF